VLEKKLDARQSLSVARPAIQMLIGPFIGSPASSASLPLLVVRRHLPNGTRTQFQKPIKPTKIGYHGSVH